MSSLISNSAADRDVIVGAETIAGGSARQKTKIGATPITGGRLLRVSVGYCCKYRDWGSWCKAGFRRTALIGRKNVRGAGFGMPGTKTALSCKGIHRKHLTTPSYSRKKPQ